MVINEPQIVLGWKLSFLTITVMWTWHQQSCEEHTETKYLISQPKCLGICLLSLIHSNNLNSRKSRGGRWSSSSKSVGGKVQQSWNNINETSLWQMACTGILCHKEEPTWPSALHAHESHQMQTFPQWGKKSSAWATWDGQALYNLIQSRTETTLKNLHMRQKAANYHCLYSWCKVFEREHSCKTPTVRLADTAPALPSCTQGSRAWPKCLNELLCWPEPQGKPGSPVLSNRHTEMPLTSAGMTHHKAKPWTRARQTVAVCKQKQPQTNDLNCWK